MTVGTNALLEGRVARTALLATEGFTDLEELGRQARPELYRLCRPSAPDRARRAAAGGARAQRARRRAAPLDEQALAASLGSLAKVEAVAVCLLWGFRHPHAAGGRARGASAARAARVHLARDRRRLPRVRALRDHDRGRRPLSLLRGYLERLAERAAEARPPGARGDAFERRDGECRDGGPPRLLDGARAGRGAVGAARVAGADAVGLDMGGTSCDVSVVLGGAAAVGHGRAVGGRALALPMVDVHTVGAGGGSIAWRDAGGALRVGPRSAGADPGPACYGRGGEEPTVTDANLLLGYLESDSPGRRARLDRGAAERGRAAAASSVSTSRRPPPGSRAWRAARWPARCG